VRRSDPLGGAAGVLAMLIALPYLGLAAISGIASNGAIAFVVLTLGAACLALGVGGITGSRPATIASAVLPLALLVALIGIVVWSSERADHSAENAYDGIELLLILPALVHGAAGGLAIAAALQRARTPAPPIASWSHRSRAGTRSPGRSSPSRRWRPGSVR
jgi:hypothetical protein